MNGRIVLMGFWDSDNERSYCMKYLRFFFLQYICFCDISQVYHQYTLIVRWFKTNLKYKGSNCCVWYSNFMVFFTLKTKLSIVFIQSDLHFIFIFFSIIIYLASDINIVLIYIIFFITLPLWQKKTIKKIYIIIPTKHYWIDIEKQNKWTIKITQTKGPRTILVPCEKVLGHDWYTMKLEIFIIDA